jgi:hypothetical protein
MKVNGQLHAPVAILPGVHWIGGWVGLGVGLDARQKRKISFLRRELNPGRPARRYTD